MKKLLILLITILCIIGCNVAPTFEQIEEAVAPKIEEMILETSNSLIQTKVINFWLDEHPSPLIYTGHLNQMIYFEDDSLKLYKNVEVKFRDKKYNFYTLEISIPK